MNARFVDTNLFIRYLTNDDPQKADKVEALLDQAAKGKIRLMTTEMVVAEVVWVLESYYGLKNTDIAPMVKAVLTTPGLEVLNARLVNEAADHYLARNVDFIDAYIAAVMRKHKITHIYSFNKKHLSGIRGIVRVGA